MENRKWLAEINYLRALKKITCNELSLKSGYSAYWLRKKINSGDKDIIKKVKDIIKDI